MKTHLTKFLALGAFAFFLSISQAHASCSAGAQKLASREKATIIAVQAKTSGGKKICEVRLKKASANGQPPRIIIKTFKPK